MKNVPGKVKEIIMLLLYMQELTYSMHLWKTAEDSDVQREDLACCMLQGLS